MLLLEKLKSYPKVGINNQIQEIKSRLVYVLEIGDDELMVDQWFNDASMTNNKDEKLELLDKIKKYMTNNINYFTMEYLNSVGIDHLNYPYVPQNPQYSTQHILPWDTQKIEDVIESEKIEEEKIKKLEELEELERKLKEEEIEEDFGELEERSEEKKIFIKLYILTMEKIQIK